MSTAILYRETARKRASAGRMFGTLQRAVEVALRRRYTWVITQDRAPHESGNRVIQHGPDGSKKKVPLPELIRVGQKFRLLDAEGNQKMSGFIVGKYKGREPLDEYGRQFGCTIIEYERDRKWIRLK